jgi:anti-sigma regulatory factor (Ser/Thr protein kinase)
VWSRAFPGLAAQAREARRFLSAIVDGCPAADDAILCLSELVANAIVHSRSGESGGHFSVRVQRYDSDLRVEVSDQGGSWEPHAHTDEHHGRGLLIVNQLTRDWGRAGDEQAGWTIWFEMECW